MRKLFEAMFDKLFKEPIAQFVVEYVRGCVVVAKLHDEIADLKVQVAALTTEVKTLRNLDAPIGKNKCRLILPND